MLSARGSARLDGFAFDRSPHWEHFLTSYHPLLKAAARSSVQQTGLPCSRDQVEDLVQDIYCHLLAQDGRRLLSIRACGEAARRSFLRRAASRVVVDQLRRAAADKRGAALLASDKGGPSTSDLLAEVACFGPTPEQYTLMREWLRQFHHHCHLLATGPQGRRNVRILLLYLVAGYTSREIASREAGALTPASVECIVARLRQRLERNGFHLPAAVRPRRLRGAAQASSRTAMTHGDVTRG